MRWRPPSPSPGRLYRLSYSSDQIPAPAGKIGPGPRHLWPTIRRALDASLSPFVFVARSSLSPTCCLTGSSAHPVLGTDNNATLIPYIVCCTPILTSIVHKSRQRDPKTTRRSYP